MYQVHTLPCYASVKITLVERRERANQREINFISAKAFKKILQRNSRGERAYLGLIWKVDDPGTKEANLGAPSDVVKLKRPDLLVVI